MPIFGHNANRTFLKIVHEAMGRKTRTLVVYSHGGHLYLSDGVFIRRCEMKIFQKIFPALAFQFFRENTPYTYRAEINELKEQSVSGLLSMVFKNYLEISNRSVYEVTSVEFVRGFAQRANRSRVFVSGLAAVTHLFLNSELWHACGCPEKVWWSPGDVAAVVLDEGEVVAAIAIMRPEVDEVTNRVLRRM